MCEKICYFLIWLNLAWLFILIFNVWIFWHLCKSYPSGYVFSSVQCMTVEPAAVSLRVLLSLLLLQQQGLCLCVLMHFLVFLLISCQFFCIYSSLWCPELTWLTASMSPCHSFFFFRPPDNLCTFFPASLFSKVFNGNGIENVVYFRVFSHQPLSTTSCLSDPPTGAQRHVRQCLHANIINYI